jgi:hypothetical protein
MIPDEFQRAFENLLVQAMTDARDDSKLRVAILSALAGGLGRCAALLFWGNPRAISDILEAASSRSFEAAADLTRSIVEASPAERSP